MDTLKKLFLFLGCCCVGECIPTTMDCRIERYNVDKEAVSVSGISSGAAMAVQYHMALSSKVMGLGVLAGVPYACASLTIQVCMSTPSSIVTDNLVGVAKSAEQDGTIDATTNMRNDRVFVYHGISDSVIKKEAGPKIVEFYKNFISPGNIGSKFDLDSEHGVPTLNYGNPCKVLGSPYLLNCGYPGAFHLLNHIYGDSLVEPTVKTKQEGKLLKLDQTKCFFPSEPDEYSMDTVGYMYVPSRCISKTKTCKLHIAFHGCGQGVEVIGEDFVRHAGYNEAGELNNIIILYPQVKKTDVNPYGCWDWFGYTGMNYGTRDGLQISAVRKMMEQIIG